jgi:hypothetical protein
MKVDIATIRHLSKHTPVIEYCRVLIARKVQPETHLEVFRTNSDGTTTHLMKCIVGRLAQLQVKENKYGTPVFRTRTTTEANGGDGRNTKGEAR